MKVITYKNLNMGETIINFLFLLFQQAIFFGLIFIYVSLDYTVYIQKDYELLGIAILVIHNIVCLIKNAISNFFTYEKYKINNGKLYYEKELKLFKKIFCFRKFEINLFDISDISILPPKEFYNDRWLKDIFAKYTEYFKPCKRIKIKLIDGKEYTVCNYVKKREYNKVYDEGAEAVFQVIANNIKDFIFEEKENYRLQKELENLKEKYNLPLEERYSFILNKIIEEKLYLYKDEEKFIVNAEKMAMKNLEIFKDMNFEEIDFYIFYINYLSKKEYEDKKVLVGYNGIDGKEVTMSKLKDDINKIRDSKSTFI